MPVSPEISSSIMVTGPISIYEEPFSVINLNTFVQNISYALLR